MPYPHAEEGEYSICAQPIVFTADTPATPPKICLACLYDLVKATRQ